MLDKEYGPEFEPLAQLFYERNMEPIVICESRERMAEDALELKRIYQEVAKRVSKT
ncbi:endonuclease IV [Caldanaerobacter subterraneus subsp. pacificus DSM 12653]|uniref:Endonuclease IV n=1 Tax=Caldanaerobacter subterraneus subsp. pacificus DSM 12653 TaxID=391606 RepID=A0A0F5PMC9_9THEO|nr:endonuclease IV [Caldanaerobacter subterraneus subsp. pacificus DSM 12653]